MVTPLLPDQALRPLNGQQLAPNATPQAFGSALGEGLQNLGRGVAAVADALMAKEVLVATADSDSAYNRYLEQRRGILSDPQTGYLNQTGANAIGGRDALTERLRRARSDVEAGLSPMALRDFQRRADALDNDAQQSAIVHESNQTRTYVNGQAEAVIASSLREAQLTYNDEVASEQHLNTALAKIDELAALNGMSPEQRDAARAAAVSEAYSNRAIQMAYDDPVGADAYLEANRDKVSPEEYVRIREGLRPVVDAQRARQTVDDILGTTPGAGTPGSMQNMAGASALIQQGKQLLGMNEQDQRAQIMEYLKSGGVNMDPAVNAWCAAFVNATLGRAGIHGTGSMMARSFATWGQDASSDPQPGDIVGFPSSVAPNDPNRGHVGILVGRDANGNYLILGGNQSGGRMRGGGVSVVPYNPDKAIFVRRAGGAGGPQEVTGAGASAALGQIMAITDVRQREAALKEFQLRLQTQDLAQTRLRQAAGDEAWRLVVEQGQDPTSLPPELQLQLGPDGMSSIIGAARTYAIGVDLSNEGTYASLIDMVSSTDPETRRAFMEMPLAADYADQLSRSDMRELLQLQRTMREEVQRRESGQAADTVYTSEDYAKAAQGATEAFQAATGWRPSASESQERMRQWHRFTTQLRAMMEDYANSTGQPVPPSIQDRMIAQLLTPITVTGPGPALLGGTATQMFDAPFRDPGARVEVDVERMDVPYAERDRITQQLSNAWGRLPTNDEVLMQYKNEALLALGLQPDMDYRDIPRDVRRAIEERYPAASREEVMDLFLEYVVGTNRPALLGGSSRMTPAAPAAPPASTGETPSWSEDFGVATP